MGHLCKMLQFELLNFYIKSDILSFQSKHEGFGLPIIEAQALGRLVLCSKCCSIPEIAANGAVYCNADDLNDLKEKFNFVLNIKNANFVNKIIENGKKIEIFNKESTQKTKIIDELILIMSFILHPTDLFYKNGSILITKDKTLLKIINYQNNIEQDYINDLINFLDLNHMNC